MNEQIETREQPTDDTPTGRTNMPIGSPSAGTRPQRSVTRRRDVRHAAVQERLPTLAPTAPEPRLTFMPSAVSKRAFPIFRPKRNLPRRQDGSTPPGKPIDRPSTPSCPNAQTATWRANFAGY